MPRAPALLLLLVTAVTAARAEDGPRGPARWLFERPGDFAGTDSLPRFMDRWKRSPVGISPVVTLLPASAEDGRRARLPTLAFGARVQGRAVVSLTRVQARADEGQEVILQRTLVSDLLAGRRFALAVYEDHTINDTTARLMGVGARLALRPAGWPFRVELLGSWGAEAGGSAYLSITRVLAPPPLPAAVRAPGRSE